MDGLEAHLGEGGQLGHHNSAISRCRFRRAGATGGGREGRPRQSRILRATAGSSIAARIRIRPPQRGHSSTTHPRRKFSPSVGTSSNCAHAGLLFRSCLDVRRIPRETEQSP